MYYLLMNAMPSYRYTSVIENKKKSLNVCRAWAAVFSSMQLLQRKKKNLIFVKIFQRVWSQRRL